MADFYNGFMNFRENGLISPYYDYHMPFSVAIPLLVAIAVISYLLGNINFAVIISKKKFHEDVRNFGSGNGGMTNMMRNYGKGAAAMTRVGDLAKAFVAVWLGISLMGTMGGYIAGLFCIIGHCFPVFLGFHGGKGVATTAMTILCLSPSVFIILFTIFVILVLGYKYISLGAIMCMLLYPVVLSMIKGYGYWNIIAILIALIVIFMHRENAKRLLNRTESKFEFRKKGDRNGENAENSEK